MAQAVGSETDPRKRLGALALALIVIAAAGVLLVGPIREQLVEFVGGFGAKAPIAFVLAYAVLSLTLVPGALLTITAGVLFGPLLGTVLAVVGGVFGATGAFLLGRRLGRRHVERVAGKRMGQIDRWLVDHGAVTIALVRIIPGVPYSLLNYTAGVTGISARDYIVGTGLGLIPGAFVYAAFGGTVDAPASPAFWASLAGIAVFLAAGAAAERWLRSRTT